MKLLIASDLHGRILGVKQLISKFNEERCDKILLLGDLLYGHGNDEFTSNYNRNDTVSLLNSYAEKITSVLGNCDSEWDVMEFYFPIIPDHTLFELDGITVFASHGNRYSPTNPPQIPKGSVMLGGHTHSYGISRLKSGIIYINPGALDEDSESYAIYENRTFKIKDFAGNILDEITL